MEGGREMDFDEYVTKEGRTDKVELALFFTEE